jgi:hypothetical protein
MSGERRPWNYRHGRSRTPLHRVWSTMIERCTSPKSEKWPLYGGRGIRVCERWLAFESFLADMGERPSPRHTLDRIDNDKGYEPGNCRWATQREQQRNRRNNRVLTYLGETMCLAAWADRVGLSVGTLGYRVRSGWPLDRALSEPKRR